MRKRIKILQLQSSAKLAGTEVSTERLISNMNKDEFENDICFFLGDGPIADIYRKKGFRVEVLNFNGKNLVSIILKLNKIIKEGNYDIINIYGYKINILGRIIASINGVKNVITAQRSIDGQRKWIHSFVDRVTSKFVKLYISNSEAARKILITREKIPKEKIVAVYNGINVEEYQSIIESGLIYKQICSNYGIKRNNTAKIITVVGNLLEPKGHTYLIDAIKILKERNVDNFIVLFAGEGILRGPLTEKIRLLDLKDVIYLLGSRSDIPQILSETDIFVLPSIWEGMPGSVMEAMASNLPVIATNVGGVSELVLDNITGFVVESKNPIQLAEKIEILLKNDALRNKMGIEGFNRIKSNFSLEKMVAEYEKEYKNLV